MSGENIYSCSNDCLFLTALRSRPPMASAELRALACSKLALFRPMLYSPAFSFSSGYPLGFVPCAGLRLGVLRQFQAFFASIAPSRWHSAFSQSAPVIKLGFPVLASGSNCAVKPTRLRRAAYFRSLVPSPALCAQPLISALGPVQKAF